MEKDIYVRFHTLIHSENAFIKFMKKNNPPIIKR